MAVSGQVKVNAPNGDIYRAIGYRLPTEAEQEYVLRGGGKVTGDYHFVDGKINLEKKAWFGINSGGTTQPVRQLEPIKTEGGDIFDTLGQVWEMSWDRFAFNISGGKDPVRGPSTGEPFVVRGASFSDNYPSINARNFVNPNERSNSVGLRLYRTLLHP